METHQIDIPRDDNGSPFGLYLPPSVTAAATQVPHALIEETKSRPASDYAFAYTEAFDRHGPLSGHVFVAFSKDQGMACIAWMDRQLGDTGWIDFCRETCWSSSSLPPSRERKHLSGASLTPGRPKHDARLLCGEDNVLMLPRD